MLLLLLSFKPVILLIEKEMYYSGGRKLFKKSFPSPAPLSFKNFHTGKFLDVHSALDRDVRTYSIGSLREGAPDGVGWRSTRA